MPSTSRESTGLAPPVRVGACVLGLAIFGAGVVAVFTTENGTGAAALLAIGAASVAVGVLGDRVQSVSLGAATLTIRDIARQTFVLAKEAELRGDEEGAKRLHAAGEALQELARGYRRIRGSMRAGSRRTVALEHLMTEARELAQGGDFEPADVSRWFAEGTPEARITALGLMQGSPRLRDLEAALDAIEAPKSPFEQYHGLRLAEMAIPELTVGQRAQLGAVVEGALHGFRVRRDSDRFGCGTRILDALGE
ncbi:MAG: hypothetical protein ACYDHN_08585 [Solirubrobacteraceae bacterium]